MTGILFSSLILRDENVNRPAAGIPGRLFFDVTNSKLQRDTGTTWEDIEGSASTPPEQYFEVIHDETLGQAGTFDVSNIPDTWDRLIVFLSARGSYNAQTDQVRLSLNGDTTDAHYIQTFHRANSAGNHYAGGGVNRFVGYVTAATSTAGAGALLQIEIPDYAKQVFYKEYTCRNTFTYASDYFGGVNSARWNSTSPVSRITLTTENASTFVVGSHLRVIGTK